MNIGLLGGTFDPIHYGHLAIAQKAKRKLSLQRVLFVPAGQPWLKVNDRNITEARHRIRMVELGILDIPYFELSRIEIDRPGPSYTIETIAALNKIFGSDTGIFLILGWDSLMELPKWHDPVNLVKACRLVAVTRGGIKTPDLDTLEKEVPGIKQSTLLLRMRQVDISSSDIRKRVAQGYKINDLVPDAVADYIYKQKLYVDRGTG